PGVSQHTISNRDLSSVVCSSELLLCRLTGGRPAGGSVALVATAAGTLGAGAASAGAGTLRRGLLGRELPGGHVALVDPHLHADAAEGGAGLVEAVIDDRPQGVQRHAPLAVELAAAHLGAAETAGDGHTDALGAGTLRGLHALAHRPAERHASSELLGNALGDQLRIGLGVLDLEDVQLDLLAGELLQLTAQPLGLRTATPDNNARAGRVEIDADAIAGALDLDPGDTGALEPLGHELADRDV